MGLNLFFIYIRIKPTYLLNPVSMNIGITLQHPMCMGMGISMCINFKNWYE